VKPVELKKTLSEGGYVFGCMLSAIGSTRFAGTLARSTLDYAIIDTEHSSRDRAEIEQLCTMLHQSDITPIVRVPTPKPEWVAMALDAGTAGVLIPYCETVEEVLAVTATAKYHPLKGMYLERAAAEGILPSIDSKKYLADRHRETFAIIGIESEPAYQNLEAILDVGNIDGVFIGPNDMSTSLGVPNDYTSDLYLDVVSNIIDCCTRRNVPVMVHQQTLETSRKALTLGARFVLHSTDAGMLQRALQAEMNALREYAGVFSESTNETVDTI
jgi:2-keto-3-deoxy-L-rhamnonate aldolase RhmA